MSLSLFGVHSTLVEKLLQNKHSLMYSQFIIKFMPQFSAPLIHCPRKVLLAVVVNEKQVLSRNVL